MPGRDDETLLAEVVRFISRFYHREVTGSTHLIADLKLDSLDIAELVAEMEDHFQVLIPMENLSEIRTVGDIAGSLTPLLNQQDQTTRSV
jgi:acyl carrier protein